MMEIVSKQLSELHLPEKNVRRHTDKQIAEYVRSVEMFGQVKPIIVDENGEIIAGNGLYMALLQMGKETCDCYVMAGMTKTQKRKLMLADNRVYELGITDTDALEDIIRELDGDIDVPGWDDDLLAIMTAAEQDADEIINSYGSYDESDVHRVENRQVPDATAAPAQQTSAETPTPAAQPAQEERFIICPKCGERICL